MPIVLGSQLSRSAALLVSNSSLLPQGTTLRLNTPPPSSPQRAVPLPVSAEEQRLLDPSCAAAERVHLPVPAAALPPLPQGRGGGVLPDGAAQAARGAAGGRGGRGAGRPRGQQLQLQVGGAGGLAGWPAGWLWFWFSVGALQCADKEGIKACMGWDQLQQQLQQQLWEVVSLAARGWHRTHARGTPLPTHPPPTPRAGWSCCAACARSARTVGCWWTFS